MRFDVLKNNCLEMAKKIKEIVHSVNPNARVFLFGSVVRGLATAMSDIDVLIVNEMIERKYDIMVKVYKNVEEKSFT